MSFDLPEECSTSLHDEGRLATTATNDADAGTPAAEAICDLGMMICKMPVEFLPTLRFARPQSQSALLMI